MGKKNILILILLLALAVTSYSLFGTKEKKITPAEAKTKVEELIAMNPGNPAIVKDAIEENNLYKITVAIDDQEFYSYLSKDGKSFYPEMIDLGAIMVAQTNTPKPEVSIKSDKPSVELFVMSHCPYGTQIEKGILPVLNLLGNKIDFELKFVDYAIHDKLELTEQTQQYCIQKQGKESLLNYLSCFLEDGNSTLCLSQSNIDNSALEKCINNTNEKYKTLTNYDDKSTWTKTNPPSPIFNVNKEDNLKYEIKGSPELIINEEKISAYRDPQNLLSFVAKKDGNVHSRTK